MEENPEPQSVCEEIAEEVRDIAISLFVGRLSPDVFARAVLALEAAKLRRHGLRLSTETLPAGGTRFKLMSARTNRPCATLDFNPATEALEIHQICG